MHVPSRYHVRSERTNSFYEYLTVTPRFLPCALTTHTHWGPIHYHVRLERTIRCTLSLPCALRAHKLEIQIFMCKKAFHENSS